jgi:hypothetical protein
MGGAGEGAVARLLRTSFAGGWRIPSSSSRWRRVLHARRRVHRAAVLAMSTTLICWVELKKTDGDGITINVQNDAGKVTQTIHLDGTTLTVTVKGENSTSTVTQDATKIIHEVKGPQETSTITQVQDKITVKVKSFEVDAETVLVKSSKDSTHEATGKLIMTSTGDMSQTSKAKWTTESTGAMTLDTKDALTATSLLDTKIAGQNATLEGKMKVTTKGGTNAEVSALKIAISGSAKVDVTSPMTTLGDTITTVKGTMVKLEGALIKAG